MANEYLNLLDKLNNAIRDEKNQRVAAVTVLSQYKPRIFEKGLDSKNSKIGTYSTKPISISKKNQARQTGKTYFKGGYAEYHGAIGKGSSNVILDNTSQMKNDLGLIKNGPDWAFGFQNDVNGNKMAWMNEKYNKQISHASEQEVNLFSQVLQDQVMKGL